MRAAECADYFFVLARGAFQTAKRRRRQHWDEFFMKLMHQLSHLEPNTTSQSYAGIL